MLQNHRPPVGSSLPLVNFWLYCYCYVFYQMTSKYHCYEPPGDLTTKDAEPKDMRSVYAMYAYTDQYIPYTLMYTLM